MIIVLVAVGVFGHSAWGFDGRPLYIEQVSGIAVDADLGDWTDAQWTPLDTVYYEDPADIVSAEFAVGWNSDGRVYVAIRVDDVDHVFTDDYADWNSSDRAEIYFMGGGEGGLYGNVCGGAETLQGPAQQYILGAKASDDSDAWTAIGGAYEIPTDADFRYAVNVTGSLITYEASMTAFDFYGGLNGHPELTTLSTLEAGAVIGFDIVVGSTRAEGYGMLAENDVENKYKHTYYLARHTLVEQICSPGDVNDDGFVGADDLVRILTNWGQSGEVCWGDGDCAPYNDGIFTGDDFIGADDYVEVLTHWGESGSPPPESIPEPATVGLLLTCFAMVRRRR